MITVSTECGLGDVIGVHAHLMVPAVEINLGEEAGTFKFVEKLINNWNRELVLDGAIVERPVVDTKTPSVVLLADQEHRGGKGRCRLPD